MQPLKVYRYEEVSAYLNADLVLHGNRILNAKRPHVRPRNLLRPKSEKKKMNSNLARGGKKE